jgi:hypothetical protein
MMKRVLVAILVSNLLLPQAFLGAGQQSSQTALASAPASPAARPAAQNSEPQTDRPQPPKRQRSYQHETRNHYHGGISNKEWVFLGAVFVTSMGIGALAGGGKGLAIGALVGGWAAYAGHRFWKWLK